MSELKIHSSLCHPNIVQFDHYFESKGDIYILLELCYNQTMGELLSRRIRLTELETQCYLVQIIEGAKCLHEHKVIHRDLKLHNLFLNENMKLKIADFGLATKLEFKGERRRTICGTPNYIAPEIISEIGGYSHEVDIWSIGVILYVLLFGIFPFERGDIKSTYNRIKTCSYNFPKHIKVSDSAKDLINKIFNLNPIKRPALDLILNHPFFLQNKVPILMPIHTLVCPPSIIFMKQYIPVVEKNSKKEISIVAHSTDSKEKVKNDLKS